MTYRWRESTSQILLDSQPAAVAAEVLDGDRGGVRAVHSIAPFDDHRPRIEQLLETEVAQLIASLQAVEVDVRQLQPAGIDADQLECGARHQRSRPTPARNAAHERGLARAELALQEDEIALAQAPAQLHARGFCLLRRRGPTQSGRIPRAGWARWCRPRGPYALVGRQ